MKGEGLKGGRSFVDLARPHTRIHISLYHILISHLLSLRHWKHLMVASCTCEDEKSATEFPPLSQIPASLALRRRRRRWNVKSGSTTADATWQTIAVADERFLSLANRYNALSITWMQRYIYFDFEVWIESDAQAHRNLHVGFAFVSV